MIRDARGDQQVIRRATQAALRAWFRQSERLNIARREYKLRGPRFTDFARRIGITDQTSAYQLVHLDRYRAKIVRRCVDDAADAVKRGQIYRYPGWETALGWFHQTNALSDVAAIGSRHLLYGASSTPSSISTTTHAQPAAEGFNSLTVEWGQRNYVNPPFSKDDVMGGRGATAFVRKAIEQQRKGKLSVIVLPVFDYVTRLLEAGAEIRPLGRVPFLDVDSRRPVPHPPNIACFILRPAKS